MAKKTRNAIRAPRAAAIKTATRKLAEARERLEQLRLALDAYENELDRSYMIDLAMVCELTDKIDVVRKAAYVPGAMIDAEEASLARFPRFNLVK